MPAVSWQCVDGFPYLNRCPSSLFFDDILKFCTFKEEARCGPIATSKNIPLIKTLRRHYICSLSNYFAAIAPITETPLDLAQRCDTGECLLPYCFCSKDGTNIPKDLPADDVSWKALRKWKFLPQRVWAELILGKIFSGNVEKLFAAERIFSR